MGRRKRGLLAAAIIGLVGALAARTPLRAEADKYQVYAIRVATVSAFPTSALVAGADRSRTSDIAMMFWVLKGADGRIALVDAGFHREKYLRQFKVADFISPDAALAPLGIDPKEVTDIILTHMHWDHAGGIDLFPNARVWVQKSEYAHYTGPAWQTKSAHAGIDADDVMTLVRRDIEGLVSFVDGEDETSISGIGFHIGGRHTFGSQYVTVATRAGTVVVASDAVYLYENLDTHTPIAQTLDAASNLSAQDRMRAMAARPDLVVPGHDPAVFSRFPHVSDRIVRIE